MVFIVIGCFSFIFMLLFDFQKIKFIHKFCNACFAIGIILLVSATMGLLLGDSRGFKIPVYLQLIWGVFALISLLLLLYSLFFWLPFRNTYIEVEKGNPVVDTGMYAVCRHPGVLWFAFFYLFLWLASGKAIIMWAGIIWTVMDILLVYVEDCLIFPKILYGYDIYKRKVPFLIPNPDSIKKGITSFNGKVGSK